MFEMSFENKKKKTYSNTISGDVLDKHDLFQLMLSLNEMS